MAPSLGRVLLVGLAPSHTLAKQRPSGGSGAFRRHLCLLVGTLSAPACIFPQTGASDYFSPSLPTPISPLEGALQPLAHLIVILGISCVGFSWILLRKGPLNHCSSIFSLSLQVPPSDCHSPASTWLPLPRDSLADPNVSISSPHHLTCS